MAKLQEKDIILKIKDKYNDEFEYYNGFIDTKHEFIIRCKKCGELKKIKYKRLENNQKKIRCERCYRKELTEIFINLFNKLHGDNWEYISGYENERSKITIRCKKCKNTKTTIAHNAKMKGYGYRNSLICTKCKTIEYTDEFKTNFNNKYKGKYEYINREYNSNVFDEDIHIIKCLECGKINKWKGTTLYNGKFNCKCQRQYVERIVDWNKKESEYKDRFNKEYAGKFEYVSGYKENIINIRCLDCGEIITRKGRSLFNSNDRLVCRNCNNNRIEYKHICEDCGEEFTSFSKNHSLCNRCSRRRNNRELKDRLKNMNRIDRNISLHKLIQRDKGICKICGRQVDINDYYYTDEGYFIAGENYPSIDHIIPLAKGGTHTWDNVQLAHRHCNSIKSDKILEQEEEQLKWI